MTPQRPCVVGFGELVWDVLPHATLPGGAPANFVWHAQQLGARGILVSAVGNDTAGRDLTGWLETMRLCDDFVQVVDAPTGRVDVQLTDAGEPTYVIHQDSSWDAIAWSDDLAAIAQQADCICFGSLSQRSPVTRATLHRLLQSASPSCLRLFDVNLRLPAPAPDILETAVDYTDILKLNEDEWPHVAGALKVDADWQIGVRQLFQKSGIRLVALTRGSRGSVLISGEMCLELAALPVSVDDTIGAGDAFAAALAVGITNDFPLNETQKVAAKVAAFVCTQAGAMPRLPKTLAALLVRPMASIQIPSSLRAHGLRNSVAPRSRRSSADAIK